VNLKMAKLPILKYIFLSKLSYIYK
jgi:hypothetical protein